MISAVIESGMKTSLLVELVTAYEDAYTRSRRINPPGRRYLPCGQYDKYDENVGADRRVCPTNTSNAIPGGQTSPVQANNEEHPACLEESENLQIQKGEH